MPTIVCTKCKAEYDVHFDTLGKKVRCKSCGASFEAQVLRAQTRKPNKINPLVILLSALGGGLFIVVVLILTIGNDDKKPPPPVGPSTSSEEAVKEPEPMDEEPEVVRTERELFCLDLLKAVEDNEVENLLKMINFPVFHQLRQAEGGPHWSDLDPVDQMLKKQEYIDKLTDDTVQGGMPVRNSDVVSVKETAWDDKQGTVEVGLKNRHNGRQQERTFTVQRFGTGLTLIDYTVGPEHGGDLVAVDKPKTLDEKYKRRISPEAEIEELPYTDDTDEATVHELKMLRDDLLEGSRNASREARERLIVLGKKAVPALLNGMVGLDMTRMEDVSLANKCISVLRVITGQSFRFAPGMSGESMLESEAADLRRALKRWFGWWNRNKDSWTGRDMEKEMEDF